MKKELDLVKNLVFLIITLTFVGMVIFMMIIPTIKEYRAQSGDYRRAILILEQLEKEHSSANGSFNALKQENKKILQSFSDKFSTEKFLSDSREFFLNTSIARLRNDNNGTYMNDFEMYEFNTTSNIKTPQAFYDFLVYLSKYSSVIEATFPINFTRDGDLINANFKLKVYNAKE